MSKNKKISWIYFKAVCKFSSKFHQNWQGYGTLKFGKITPLCHFFRINKKYFLKYKKISIHQITKLLTQLLMKVYVKFQYIWVGNVGVIPPYLLCNIFCQINRYLKITILKKNDIKILGIFIDCISLNVPTLVWTKKNQEKALNHRVMAVEIDLPMYYFSLIETKSN